MDFARLADLKDLPTFSEQAVSPGPDEPGWLRVEVDGSADSLRFYGLRVGRASRAPLVFFEGDVIARKGPNVPGRSPRIILPGPQGWVAIDGYAQSSPALMQREAEQVALSIGRTFVNLARPGIHGSSGNHLHRRRPREVALVDAALSRLKQAFGWDRIDLAGLSGGGHTVAALMGRRSDIGCAVIASGNVAIGLRNREAGRDADVTGFTDFVDPIDLVADVARHPPRRVIALTDPDDAVVSWSVQTAYVEALRGAGVAVDHRLVPALDPGRHVLRAAAMLAAASVD